MTKYSSHNLIYILLLVWVFIDACNNTSSQNEKAIASKPSPERIGIPPPSVSLPSSGNELEKALSLSAINRDSVVSDIIRSIFQDSKGILWFGTLNGVLRYDGEIMERYSKMQLMPDYDGDYKDAISVHAIAEDKNRNIWFGTDGVIEYDGRSFKSYSEKNGLDNIRIGRKSILVDKSGNIWVGTEAGVFLYDPSAGSSDKKCFSQFRLLPNINVKGIMEDKAGNIWFASRDNGVFRYDGKAIKNITEKERLGDNTAGGMIEDKTGNVWFTMKGGICRYDGKTFTEITTKDGLGGSEVWGIAIEKSGIIWITARGSTTRYDPSIPISDAKAFTVFGEGAINCCVQSMYQDRSGNMWFGTGAGLYRFDGKRFYQVKENGPW